MKLQGSPKGRAFLHPSRVTIQNILGYRGVEKALHRVEVATLRQNPHELRYNALEHDP